MTGQNLNHGLTARVVGCSVTQGVALGYKSSRAVSPMKVDELTALGKWSDLQPWKNGRAVSHGHYLGSAFSWINGKGLKTRKRV